MIEIKYNEELNKALAYDSNKIIGECVYTEEDNTWNIIHTKVSNDYQGQGIAKKLVLEIMNQAKSKNKDLIADCSYAHKLITK